MTTPRDSLLAPSLKIPAGDVKWYFMSDFYDGPISGLAIFRGRFLRCCCFQEDLPKQRVYVLQELSEVELAEEKRFKAKFERMVGTYGCFDESGELMPKFVGDDASRAQFFAEEKSEAPPPTPYERPIIAWFDTSEE